MQGDVPYALKTKISDDGRNTSPGHVWMITFQPYPCCPCLIVWAVGGTRCEDIHQGAASGVGNCLPFKASNARMHAWRCSSI